MRHIQPKLRFGYLDEIFNCYSKIKFSLLVKSEYFANRYENNIEKNNNFAKKNMCLQAEQNVHTQHRLQSKIYIKILRLLFLYY